MNTRRLLNSLVPDQTCSRPDLNPNRLQRLSAGDFSRERTNTGYIRLFNYGIGHGGEESNEYPDQGKIGVAGSYILAIISLRNPLEYSESD